MSLLDIKKFGDKALKTPSKDVDIIDKEIKKLINDMLETMYAASGLGLAANQVGVLLNLIVIDINEDSRGDNPLILINPVIIQEEGRINGEEGCLSFPKIYTSIERPKSLILEALNINGELIRIEAENLLARVISHECDHLKGILIIDRVNPITRALIKKQITKRINQGEW